MGIIKYYAVLISYEQENAIKLKNQSTALTSLRHCYSKNFRMGYVSIPQSIL